eukprot:5096379-Pleurochrysis_carterae.AAC.1
MKRMTSTNISQQKCKGVASTLVGNNESTTHLFLAFVRCSHRQHRQGAINATTRQCVVPATY